LLIRTAISAGATLPAEIQSLIDQARSAPAEFSAAALLRLAESDKVDRAAKPRLLEDAFRQAALAQQRWKRRAVDPRSDASTAFLSKAFAQNLDTGSLQTQAVKALLPLDARKARTLFLEIAPPQLDPLGCDDNLVYDISAYYDALAEIVNSSFTPREIAAEEPLKLVEWSMAGLASPLQLGPVAKMLAALQLKPGQGEALLTSFSGALQAIEGDPRSFGAATDRVGGLGAQIQNLAAASPARQMPNYPLIEAYRAFLVRHLRRAVCAGTGPAMVSYGVQPAQPPPQDAVSFFNGQLRAEVYPPGAEIKPISSDEIQPAQVEDLKPAPSQCGSEECRRLVSLYRALIFNPQNLPLTPAEKETTEWQSKLKEYIGALAEWKDPGGSGAPAYFRQKCALYSDLVNLVPKSADRDRVLPAFLGFLNRNPYQGEHRAEWFLPVNTLVGRIFADSQGMAQTMRDLRGTEDPVIALFANLEQMFPRSPSSFLPLL
jgi:hypothetical protein